MKPSELFCFKYTIKFTASFFSQRQAIKNSIAYYANKYPPDDWSRLVKDGMSMGLTNTHTALGFSDLYNLFARKRCILCSALRQKCCLTLLWLSLH